MFTPSSLQALTSNNIDLWTINPSKLSTQSVNWLSDMLSPTELESVQRYKHKTAQHTALVTRSICRLVLAQYTSTPPSSLSFIRNAHGKPELEHNANRIRFNLSHNNQQIILAVCVDDDIGCDIEDPTRKVSIEPITRRYFAPQEHQAICALEGPAQKERFFEVWTLKEAFVKATGVGISLGLDTFYFEKNKTLAIENQLTYLDESKQCNAIKVSFNENYTLDKNTAWQFFQTNFEQQLVSICRSSTKTQQVTFLDTSMLIASKLTALN